MTRQNAHQGNRGGAEAAEIAESKARDERRMSRENNPLLLTSLVSPLRSQRPLRLCGCLGVFEMISDGLA